MDKIKIREYINHKWLTKYGNETFVCDNCTKTNGVCQRPIKDISKE